MITRLREALYNEDICTPDEVINILTTAMYEKEKLKLQMQYMQGQSDDEVVDEDKVFLRRNQLGTGSRSQ